MVCSSTHLLAQAPHLSPSEWGWLLLYFGAVIGLSFGGRET